MRKKLQETRLIRAALRSDPATREHIREYLAVARPIIEELVALGYQIETLGELRLLGRPWKTALPTLLQWLPRIDDPRVKEDIVRSLSVPWVGRDAAPQFIEEFKKAGPKSSLAWAIGNALSIVDISGSEQQIFELAKDPKYGIARQMIILGLGRLQRTEAENVALSLLFDEDVKLHAVIALGKMKSQRALPELEHLFGDKRAIVRREARKATANIRPAVT